MSDHPLHLASAPLAPPPGTVHGDFVTLGSRPFYRIRDVDGMDPFFMSIVSASDHWMFISSLGGLTAGRRNADNALFPYYASDRIHDDADHTGSCTVLRVDRDGRRLLWEPLAPRAPRVYRTTRSLYKNAFGNVLVFEEVNHDLALCFRTRWSLSDRFGFVKRSEVHNLGPAPARVEVLDGVQNLLPWGVQEAFQVRYSVLGDAYKQNEVEPDSGLATFAYSSLPGDSAEPAEALRATVCWSTVRPDAPRLVSSSQVDAFRAGGSLTPERRVCGRRGAYFVADTLTLTPDGAREWLIVADLAYGAGEIAALRRTLAADDGGRAAVDEDLAESTARLVRIVARADGVQRTGDRAASAHHVANVLFNVMRGGVFASGYRIDLDDLRAGVAAFNRATWRRHEDFLAELGDEAELEALRDAVASREDPDLLRLVTEYLPISFSRRHGDPSRPWNRFSIEVRDPDGSRRLGYEGNWRDIFQNWEALCHAFPEYLDGVIAKFLNTSTADGYNPYRITHRGFDWEEPNPDEPWANLGYWGDHQIVYLLKLLEASRAHHPGRLEALLGEARFVYADVPYDIRPYPELLDDPRHSIAYNREREERIAERVESVGLDGRLLTGPDGDIVRANLGEKLLVPLLAKLANLVPGGGFWMNTQRPEWNDANNALAGYGLSMVTLYYARRYVVFCRELFGAAEGDGVALHREVADWLRETRRVLSEHRDRLDADPLDGAERKAVLDGLGRAAGDYRGGLYATGLGAGTETVAAEEVQAFLGLTLEVLDHSIGLNRRDDGLYHAYNVLKLAPDAVEVEPLYPMLEGQVAVLSSGALAPGEAVAVLDALRASDMYREDQHTYMLYPDRTLPGFLDKNRVPPSQAARSRLIGALLAAGDTTLVEQDVDGHIHFNPAFRNAGDVREALARLDDAGFGELIEEEGALVQEIFESIFDHARFTGRSGTFYGYEGLGCIYWHMVGKLLLATQECALAARDDRDAFQALAERYHDVRAGLGFNKAPDVYGAFPTDPYSHTPGYAGAKQPGMTGQVKEEILTRMGEFGIRVDGGRIHFEPLLLRPDEFLDEEAEFAYHDVDGRRREIRLDPGTLAFTHCQVPVVYRRGEAAAIRVHGGDGSVRTVTGSTLDEATSAEIFRRSGAITRLDVTLVGGLAPAG
jgi:hypothetical protein